MKRNRGPKMATKAKSKIEPIKRPTAEFEVIDTKRAQELLRNNPHNRSISKRRVEDYAYAMIGGDWKLTGQPIQIDTRGRLIDGQHRLQAVLMSGESQEMLVVSGLGTDIFDVIDAGKQRTPADALTVDGHIPARKANMMAAAARFAIAYEAGFKHPRSGGCIKGTPNKVIREWVEERPDFLMLADSCEEWYGGGGIKPMADGGLLFHLWEQWQVDQNKAEPFMRRVYTATGCVKDDLEYQLRERLIQARAGHIDMHDTTRHAIVVQTWNALRGVDYDNPLFWHRATDFPRYQ